jgi:EAL domain-containing protein (putative c-di-GMP-specific phosphodiesterase class I)
VNTLTGEITGTEALIRWNHSELGLVPPDQFISLAEETGVIVPIGEWVLNEACRQTRAWQEAGYGPLHIAVNVSGVQFRQPNLIEVVHNALETSGLDPACLTLEMTESVIMDEAKENIEALHKIKELGLELSIDDFGTGYSCLSYLSRFPLDELKVDRAFVNEIQHEDDDGAIVTAVLAMADSLGLRVVAEGVETEAQLAFLKRRSCAQYQGYLFSRPLPAGELPALLTVSHP